MILLLRLIVWCILGLITARCLEDGVIWFTKPLYGVKIGSFGLFSWGGERIKAGVVTLLANEDIVKKLSGKGARFTNRIGGPHLGVGIRWVYLPKDGPGLSIVLNFDPLPYDGLRTESKFVEIPLKKKSEKELAHEISEAVYEFLRKQPKAVNKKGSSLTGRASLFFIPN